MVTKLEKLHISAMYFEVLIDTSVRVSTRPGKPGNPGNVLEFFFCPGICPGIYHFQSFVLEMSWKFFATVHLFFSHYICQSSQHREIFGKFFTILDPI